MCGICGMIGEAPAGALEAMVSAMGHRGPDDSGIHREGRVSLGMTRLAVIDLSAMARQPMRNPEGSVWIVYNGETYNFREEREILEGKGHSFASASDTEVVLRMYEQYGDDFLLRMRGMFALAIYDRRRGAGKEKVLLARDPLGIKPLLYAGTKSGFVFASEMKAILASGLIDGGIDPVSLRLLLVHGSVTQPATVLRGVRMLLPGHRMVLERGSLREEPYWRIAPGRVPGLREAPYPEIVERAREALAESVRLQMVSDVPVGAFLSGGLDSSLLVSLMASLGGGRVRTFSVGFEAEGAHIDETDDAYRIAKFLETDHTRVPVTGKEVAEFLPRIASALDQPSVDGVNSFFVSRAASGGVKVAVSGTGGDELFAGYPWFAEMAASDAWDREHPVLASLRRWRGAPFRFPLLDPLATGRYAGRIEGWRAASGFLPRYARAYRIFSTSGASAVLAPALRRPSGAGREPSLDAGPEEIPGGPTLERVSALCLRGYTLNQLLRDIDAVSMSHSLEVRVPFLDPVVTDLALSLPAESKLYGKLPGPAGAPPSYRESGAKRILVDVGKGLLPEGMDLQPKRGFAMPFDAWLRGPLREAVTDTLSSGSVRRRGLFDERETGRLLGEFLEGRGAWTFPWLLMMTELWCREVLDRASLPGGDRGGR